MPLYLIRRPFPGAKPAEIDAAGFRALACAPFYPGMRWIRSFHDTQAEEMFCIYEARSADDIWRHAEQSSIPCASVVTVSEIVPPPVPAAAASTA
ncbi:MAG: nickel-binding protein [Hyphomicrobiales bacterium]